MRKGNWNLAFIYFGIVLGFGLNYLIYRKQIENGRICLDSVSKSYLVSRAQFEQQQHYFITKGFDEGYKACKHMPVVKKCD